MPRETRRLWTQPELQRSPGGRGQRPRSEAAQTAGLTERPAAQANSDHSTCLSGHGVFVFWPRCADPLRLSACSNLVLLIIAIPMTDVVRLARALSPSAHCLQCGVWALAVSLPIEHREPAGVGETPALRDLRDGGSGTVAIQQVVMRAV
jgi:hypothetical protein